MLERVPTGLYSRYSLHVEAVEEAARRAIAARVAPTDRLEQALAMVERFRRFRAPNRNAYAQALTAGAAAFDLELHVPEELVGAVSGFLDAMKDLDVVSRVKDVGLPTAPADVVAFRRWLIGEATSQLGGHPPVPYAEERAWALRPEDGPTSA